MELSPASKSGANVSVVMISLNEEGAIRKVIEDIKSHLPEAEIVVVDSSTDRTPEIAESLGAKVVRQFPPRGYGNAMDLALTSATRDVVVTLDCDDTYPVRSIFDLLQHIEAGCDLVSGSRLGKRPENMPFENYLANWLFAVMALFICGVRSTDVHTGMRAYRKSLIQQFPYNPHGAALPVELQVGPAALGYRCAEIFIDYAPRIGESKLRKIESTIWTFKRLWVWRFFFNPHRQNVARQLAIPKA